MASRKLFIIIDSSRYRGRYVALVDNHVISSGKDAKTVWARAKKKNPAAVPTLVKAPKGETLVLLQSGTPGFFPGDVSNK